MFEVIIERPRVGSNYRSRRKGRHGEPGRRQEAPRCEPMSVGRGSKHLNENLAPLRRFLQRRVGRPWDAVRSEICARLKMTSAVQKHVLDHVKEMVEENPVFIDGTPHHPTAWGHGRATRFEIGWNHWHVFYVCPETRTLRMVTTPRKRKRVMNG
jgi:hypothetical protein